MSGKKDLKAIADEYFKTSSASAILLTEDGTIFLADAADYAESHRQSIKGEKVHKFEKGKKPAKADTAKTDDLDSFTSDELVDIASQKGSKKTKKDLAKMSDKDLKNHISSLK